MELYDIDRAAASVVVGGHWAMPSPGPAGGASG